MSSGNFKVFIKTASLQNLAPEMPPIRLPAARARVFRRLLNAIYNQFPPGLERHLVFQYVLEYLSRASFAHFWIAFVFFINRQLYFPVYPSQEDWRRMNPSLSRLGGYFARRTGDPPLPEEDE